MNTQVCKVYMERDKELEYSYMLDSSENAKKLGRDLKIAEQPQEHMYVACVDTGKRITNVVCVGIGTFDQAIVDTRAVIIPAILSASSGIILFHNHPGGTCRPSSHDMNLTQKLKDACKLLHITLLDHIILTDKAEYSFAEDSII